MSDEHHAYLSALTPGEQLLRQAIDAGLTFGACIKHFALKNGPKEEAYIERAREQYHREGEVEIDDTTICSGSNGDGDYVLAWVWVDD